MNRTPLPFIISNHLEDYFSIDTISTISRCNFDNPQQVEDLKKGMISLFCEHGFAQALMNAEVAFQQITETPAVSCIRTDLSWYLLDPLPDEKWKTLFNDRSDLTRDSWRKKVLKFFKDYVNCANHYKLGVLVVLYKAPNWAIKDLHTQAFPKMDAINNDPVQMWNQFQETRFSQLLHNYCLAIAEAVGNDAWGYQIWNEPNNPMQNEFINWGEPFAKSNLPGSVAEWVELIASLVNSGVTNLLAIQNALLNKWPAFKDTDFKFQLPGYAIMLSQVIAHFHDHNDPNKANNILYDIFQGLQEHYGVRDYFQAAVMLYANKTMQESKVVKPFMLNLLTDNDRHWSDRMSAYYRAFTEIQGHIQKKQPDFQHSIKTIGIDLYPCSWKLYDSNGFWSGQGWDALDLAIQHINNDENLKGCNVAIMETGFSTCGQMPSDTVNNEKTQAEWILCNLPDAYTKIQENNRKAVGPKVTFLCWYELGIKTTRTKTANLSWSIIDFIKHVIDEIIDRIKDPFYIIKMINSIIVMEQYFGIFHEVRNPPNEVITPKLGFKALCNLQKSVIAGDMTLFTGDRVVLQDMNGHSYFRIAYQAPGGTWIEHYAPIAGRAEDECGTFTVTVTGENEIALRADNRHYLGICSRYSNDGVMHGFAEPMHTGIGSFSSFKIKNASFGDGKPCFRLLFADKVLEMASIVASPLTDNHPTLVIMDGHPAPHSPVANFQFRFARMR